VAQSSSMDAPALAGASGNTPCSDSNRHPKTSANSHNHPHRKQFHWTIRLPETRVTQA
jgi:hypothetical protein